MATLNDPNNAADVVRVGAAPAMALHAVNKPVASLGHYSYGGFTGVLPAALAANSEIFQFRYTGLNIAVIKKLTISAAVSTTAFAAGVPVQIDLVQSTGWSVAGTGGTAITPAALLRRRRSMANTAVASGDIRIATNAALGAGTKTLETLAIATLLGTGPTTIGNIIPPGTILYQDRTADGGYPLALVQNEGLSIRSVAVPGAGQWQMAVNVEWCEVSAF